jgi:hypothetical protein
LAMPIIWKYASKRSPIEDLFLVCHRPPQTLTTEFNLTIAMRQRHGFTSVHVDMDILDCLNFPWIRKEKRFVRHIMKDTIIIIVVVVMRGQRLV